MPQQLATTLTAINVSALTAALRTALGGNAQGISTYGPTRPISVWLADDATDADHAAALEVCAAHDPVSISQDKAAIAANGVDAVTITVNAVSTGAPVTLVVTQPGGSQSPQAVPLVGGMGSVQYTTVVSGVYTFAVQNGANRCVDTLQMVAS